MSAMNRPLPVFLFLVCAGISSAAAQDSVPNLALLGIKELAYEVPHFLHVRGGGETSYQLGSGGTVYRTYNSGGGITDIVGGDIYVIDRRDAKPRLLVRGASHPAWSPDGSQFAYCKWSGLGYGQIEVANADGTGARQLTDMKGGACFPDWSPDGTKIAFTALSPGAAEKNLRDAKNTGIFVVDKNGRNPVPITSGYAARWSPGGSLLIFLRRSEKKGMGGSIWLGTPDGKQTKMVAVSDRVMEGAAWLPNGRGIVASYMVDGSYSVFRSYLDGSQARGAPPQKIADDVQTDWSWPALSPDGKQLMGVVVGCAPDKPVKPPWTASCLTGRIVLLDLDTKKETWLAGGMSYSVMWDQT